MASTQYYRPDGVRLGYDPTSNAMAEKYGQPGETDGEGFNPYADTVGPGIYGGIVKRDENGQVVIGRQYQDHNSRPGPVYAGGGYTPMNEALVDVEKLKALLAKHPDLINDVSTGGAQPLHMCGMSSAKQDATATLIGHGADVEALDTYGFTPLHRMASNNLAAGAKALLAGGADPNSRGQSGITPLEMARQSNAVAVVNVLRAHGTQRKPVSIAKIVVAGAEERAINGEYVVRDASEIPDGFGLVCRANGWDTDQMWRKLNGGSKWFHASNGAYIYYNLGDAHWWIDEPNGSGVFKAQAPAHAPPQLNWKPLGAHGTPPSLVAAFRELE